MKKTRILLADDHPVVLKGIRNILAERSDFEIVGETSNGNDILKLVKSLKPQILIVDFSMQNLDGGEAILQIKKVDPCIRVIVFSMNWDYECVANLVNQSCLAAYILKEDPASELMHAIEAAGKGEIYFSKSISNVLPNSFEKFNKTAYSSTGSSKLTLREREVLQLLAEGDSLKEIAEKLQLSPKTVESHKYNIMKKLCLSSLADLTRFAIKTNLAHL